MKTAQIVIGSGFGDEGKGLFTDYLSSQSEKNACVVRFNGGAQAGHTVHTTDGKRHVFSHFSSGSFAGLPTFLSQYYVCSPITFLREQKELLRYGVKPNIFVDELCPVTTPYDIMINQIVEQSRGNNRHGSVGIGFGETLERHLHNQYALTVDTIKDIDRLRSKLNMIQDQWAPERLASLGIKDISDEWAERFNSEAIREKYIKDVEQFLAHVTVVPSLYLNKWDHLIFEGAQGLLLDQNRGWFPHVTRSNTGIRNVLSLLEGSDLKELDVYYLSRSYTTRHGAGPLPNELSQLPYKGIVDETNRPHQYQGNLRFAWFDADLFRDTVLRDLADGAGRFNLRPHVAMSCLDQIEGNARYISKGVLHSTSTEALLNLVRKEIGATSGLASFGPTRATIQSFSVSPIVGRTRLNKGLSCLNSLTLRAPHDTAKVSC